ncbi:enolase C-terminal domain-like protein [Buchananella felis]|uniref:enolase C-terminal domain-like protein n=1 Tax=Buchananella felis TaxID=3231492 RepID=UPI0035275EA0
MRTALTTTALPVPPYLGERGVGAVFAYRVPLRARFRGLWEREGLLLAGIDREAVAGPGAGWGECSPFWNYGPEESAAWLRAALAAVAGELPAPAALVPVNLTVPALNGAELEAYLDRLLGRQAGAPTGPAEAPGGGGLFAAAKVKVAESGQELRQDRERLEAVRRRLPAASIRIDANAAWSVEQALAALPVLNQAAGGLEYCEQPCASVAELAEVREAAICPVAADESIRRAADPLAVAAAGAADYMIVKSQPLGGALAAAQLAARVGLPAVASSAIETSVGLAAGYRLASELARGEGLAVPRPAGLGTANLLAGDVVDFPLAPRGGALWEVDLPGYAEIAAGVESRLTEDADLRARWGARLDAMGEYL